MWLSPSGSAKTLVSAHETLFGNFTGILRSGRETGEES